MKPSDKVRQAGHKAFESATYRRDLTIGDCVDAAIDAALDAYARELAVLRDTTTEAASAR